MTSSSGRRVSVASAAASAAASSLPSSVPSSSPKCFHWNGKHQLFILEMRNRLLVIDAFICFAVGALLFFAPTFVATLIFIQRTDGVHWHLLRCIGGQKIAAGFVMYRMRNSTAEALTACYLIRVLVSFLPLS
ncbi:unnamed protein product [Gongylonema pulchrum]|uniref:Uncharacterized protein n=1 Tax=Gongylonema pulchrum TaxID=637853 RepID=A0A183ETW1_9BILA|nr:unnamed protein product [Gongylonema pulchrum]